MTASKALKTIPESLESQPCSFYGEHPAVIPCGGGRFHTLSVCPALLQALDKKRTKLEIAAEMGRRAMETTGTDRQVFLLCDSFMCYM